MNPTPSLRAVAVATLLSLGALGAAQAQQVVLKVHHFLPSTSNAQVTLIQPWCDKIAKESNNRLKCQIYPAMQLGGTPPQLFDQAKDGVADIVWTVPTYSAGRFTNRRCSSCPSWCRTPRSAARRCGPTCRRTRSTSSRART